MAWKTWDDAFLHHRGKGCDPSDAAYRADEWQKRQKHCRGAVRHALKGSTEAIARQAETIKRLERMVAGDLVKTNERGENQ